MTTTPVVSVIIPCYNARPWLSETLSTALQPTWADTEVILVDDGSTDGSGDYVREHYPQVRLFVTPNRGVSQARNLGLEHARGAFLIFLDADDLLPSGRIDRHLHLLERSDAEVIYGDWQRLRPTEEGRFVPAEVVARTMTRPPELELFGLFWCPPGAYTFRRSIVERVGGFNPRLPVIQDARFALDCALHGGRFVHDPHLSCLYRTHRVDSVSTRSQSAFWRDCLTNAIEVRAHWEQGGELTPERLRAVLEVCDTVARATVNLDQETFEAACREVQKHLSWQAPPGRPLMRVLTRWLGYRRVRRLVAGVRPLLKRRSGNGIGSLRHA